MSELKPCPFCGFPAKLKIDYCDKKKSWYLCVRCSGCYTTSRTFKTSIDPKEVPGFIDKAVATWNFRCPENAVPINQ